MPQNYDHAFYFAKSAGFDVADLHRLVHDARSKTQTTITCTKLAPALPIQVPPLSPLSLLSRPPPPPPPPHLKHPRPTPRFNLVLVLVRVRVQLQQLQLQL